MSSNNKEFADAVSRDSHAGPIIVDLSNVDTSAGVIVLAKDPVQINPPLDGQDNRAGVMTSCVTPGSYDIGQLVKGKGVYQGVIQLPEKFDIELPKMDLWAAPKDLRKRTKRALTYNDTVAVMAALKNFYGYDGVPLLDRPEHALDISYEHALYQYFSALAEGKEKPGWVIAPYEALRTLNFHKDKMPKSAKLVTRLNQYCPFYLSCTEDEFDTTSVLSMNFINGSRKQDPDGKECDKGSVRPVLMEPQLAA